MINWIYMGLMMLFGAIVGRLAYEWGKRKGRDDVNAAWRRAVKDYRIIDRASGYEDALE